MKINREIDDKLAWRFDNYRQNFKSKGLFTEFETGTVLFNRKAPDPSERRLYANFNVEVISTAEAMPQLYTLEGEKIPKSWLAHDGIQYMLKDLDRGVVVGLGEVPIVTRNQWPKNCRSAAVYWASEDSYPKGAPIKVFRPYVPPEEEKVFIAELTHTARVFASLKDYKPFMCNNSWKISPTEIRTLMGRVKNGEALTDIVDAWTSTVTSSMAFGKDVLSRDLRHYKYLSWEGSNVNVTNAVNS